MKKISLIFSILTLIALGICYTLSKDKELNYLPNEAPQLSDYDSIVRSFYLSNLMHSSQFVVDAIDDSVSIGFAIKMDKIIREHNDTILEESHYSQAVHPETFWKHRYRLQFCDCFWEANFFNFGTPKTNVRGLKGIAIVELAVSDSTKGPYEGGTGELTAKFKIKGDKNIKDEIFDIIVENGKTMYYSEVVSPKDTLSTFRMIHNNPSKIFNENELRLEIDKLVKWFIYK